MLGKKSASELDPLTYRLVNDTRPRPSKASKTQPVNMSAQLDLPYERLPPSGLLHPFVSAILLPWLGPHADSEAVKFGLATLRTWWQHRSNSLNKTAIKKLQDSEFRAIVDQYTHHFFELAHCLVVHDKEQGPSTLQKKLKRAQTELDKGLLSDRFNSDRSLSVVQMLVGDSAGLSPLEKMHAAQKLIAEGVSSMNRNKNAGQIVNVKGKCIPGKIDLSNMAHTVNRYNSTQLAHRGISSLSPPKENSERFTNPHSEAFRFGDPKSTPVIYKDLRGDSLIVLEIAGISCAHCVQIVETVLKGCKGHGQQSPITGLLDAAADHKLSLVVIRIEDTTDGSRALAEAGSLQNIAKKVAYEACRNLALVGYTAQAKKASMGSNEEDDNDQLKDDLCLPLKCLQTTIATYANAYPRNFFDFSLPCTCPDNGIFRASCPRYVALGFQHL